MNRLYLIIDLLSVSVPLLYSFHPKIKFYRTWRSLFPAIFITAIIFLTWDAIFTYKAVWGFSTHYTIGISISNLPFEEIFFFICIPYSCVFTYYCLNRFYKIEWADKTGKIICLLFALSLLIAGFYFYDKLYTSVTFISTGILLLFFKFIFRIKWLEKYFTVYLVMIIPFFIVNGILTGTGLKEPIVWYNNHENMDIRLWTIPAEDIIYGFEMILLNIFFYEYFNARPEKNHKNRIQDALS